MLDTGRKALHDKKAQTIFEEFIHQFLKGKYNNENCVLIKRINRATGKI